MADSDRVYVEAGGWRHRRRRTSVMMLEFGELTIHGDFPVDRATRMWANETIVTLQTEWDRAFGEALREMLG
jgi:hypothetical protein